MRPSVRRVVLHALASAWWTVGAGALTAQEPERDSPPTAADAAEPEEEAYDPCAVTSQGEEAWLDRVEREVYESVCETALFFDGFFGADRYDRETYLQPGRLSLGLELRDNGEVGVDGRLRVRVRLPNLERRVDAYFGRESEEDVVTGRGEQFRLAPSSIQSRDEPSWLAGIGYTPLKTSRRRLDLTAGVNVRFPLEPFVQGRYRRHWILGGETLVRARETVFWRNQYGLGTTTTLDLERTSGGTLFRLGGSGTLAQELEGLRWNVSFTVYHYLQRERALAIEASIDGETRAPVTVNETVVRFIYRQRMFRDWFFGELVTGVAWPREEVDDLRRQVFLFGFGFELLFGERHADD